MIIFQVKKNTSEINHVKIKLNLYWNVFFPPVTNNLSKSSTLTRSTTNLEEISPQNKIAPLVVIPNAPFEQSFRITVYLPFGQLYVARIGAKTKLSDLLDTICVNKSLDPNKFEFKHPGMYGNIEYTVVYT